MALAAIGDVEAALGRPLTAQEAASIAHLLDTATDRVTAYLGGTPDPVPGEVRRVVADVGGGVGKTPPPTPPPTADYSAGGYYQQREAAAVTIAPDTVTTTGTWLSREQKARLRPFLMRGGGGMRRAYTIALYDAADETPPVVDVARYTTTTAAVPLIAAVHTEPTNMVVGATDTVAAPPSGRWWG